MKPPSMSAQPPWGQPKETEHKHTHTSHSRDFFPEISVAGKSRRPPRTTTARLAVERNIGKATIDIRISKSHYASLLSK
jgi:hypothetical protein